ncbi:hypothetical protein AMES_8449 [Amycolatopsis mediterranei S699]|uniref:Uncharacterized protein n=2 Tax=Amycolatopsis mediterranei TaxID=33910 RepID=A0A0H3DHD6_AMYMU|nr:hypothetical protein [Amycolatopsis mediterranei]ADJ50275.1 conserved hypothetical protein [Amycolatopsis mediterranei U32]AEK47275.1 hypothetical protein RAM_44040 [Amycolatopsis mediterranei S699]AFO81981.1 hypothetical protein AMES_8449 [Amycolatopsis mediterranei S699]AGT89110.1 hypothetical protein B737_8450 [Amycolatopsis mediterranei RB]KDO08340.1 hypothetical protein DV26_24615 [Amycolatopsis mediterranei]
MSKENVAASEAKEQKSGLRIAQVLAAALAAVTAALLGSTLGVAGTVVGAGVASVVSTVGSELYLRSLQRTREAALKARQLATSGIRRRGPAEEPSDVPITDQPTVQLAKPEPSQLSARLRKLRWPLIIGTSVAAFAVAILSIVGFESATGTQIGGGTGSSIGKIFSGGSGRTDQTPSKTPPTSTNDTQVSPTETTTTPPSQSSTAPTTSSETPTTTPSTTTEQPSTSAPATTATPPTSKGAASTPTP